MEEKTIDLHVHSTESDGTLTPEEVVTAAADAGLAAIALTDHDTVSGVKKAQAAADACGLELVPGIELSTEYAIPGKKASGKEIHIVGLFIDPEDPVLLKKTKEFRECRDSRNEKIVAALRQEGFAITMEALTAENPDSVITRANIARFLYNHGCIRNIQEAFDKYIGDGCRCYVGRFKVSPMEAVALIKQAGGTAILAHPLLYHMGTESLKQLIDTLREAGLDGIEAIYGTYTDGDERLVRKLAAENGLLISGGSDFHGSNKPAIHLGTGQGRMRLPYSVLSEIKAYRSRTAASSPGK